MVRRVASTPSEIKAMIEEVANEMAARGSVTYPDPMEPPWQVFPGYSMTSMCWRMGGGDDYMTVFTDWFRSLPQAHRAAFVSSNPEPEGWLGFYERPSLNPHS